MSYTLGEFPVLAQGGQVGSVIISQNGLMTVFDCSCRYACQDILRLAAVCGGKYVPLGVVMPCNGVLSLNKSFSKTSLASLGYSEAESFHLIKSGELYPQAADSIPAAQPEESAAETEIYPVLDISEPVPADTSDELVPQADHGLEPAPAPAAEPEKPLFGDMDDFKAQLGLVIEQLTKSSDVPAEVKQDQSDMDFRANSEIIDGWSRVPNPGALFSDDSVAVLCEGITGAMMIAQDEFDLLAVPVSTMEPFPLMPVFCFGTSGEIAGKEYIIFKIRDGNLTL